MKTKLKLFQIFSLALVGLLMVATTPAHAVPQAAKDKSGNVTVSTDGLFVTITGNQNIPSYTFGDPSNNGTKYKVSFDSVFEVQDTNGNGVYDLGADHRVGGPNNEVISLNSLSWNFTDVTKDGNDLHFDMTSSNGMFQFKNHIYADQQSQMKFDIVIDGYNFTSQDNILVLAFKVIKQGGDNSQSDANTEQDNNGTVRFDTGFFQSASSASADNGDVNVGMSTGSNSGSMIYLSYGYFTGVMTHDPTIGVNSTSEKTSEEFSNSRGLFPHSLSKGALALTTIVATMFAVLIPLTIYRRKNH